MQVKKQLELDMEQRTVQNWERSMPRCILSPCLFNLYAEYILQNARADEAQLESRLLGTGTTQGDGTGGGKEEGSGWGTCVYFF